MHSIPQALMWELTTRGRWKIPAFFILGSAVPMLIYAALRPYSIDPNDPAFVMIHVMFHPIVMLQFAIGVFDSQGRISRLFATPISTGSLVTWHMFPGGILLGIQVAASLWAQNLLLDASYHVLGPALFAVAAWSAAQVLVCVSHRNVWSFFLAMLPVVLLFCWLGSRYGGWFSQPTHYWSEVTPGEIFTLSMVTLISWVVTVAAVRRERCGEHLPPLFGWRWLVQAWERWDRRRSGPLPPFSSVMQAQHWFEWRLKGSALPGVLAAVLIFSGIVVLLRWATIGNLQHDMWNLYEGLQAGGFLLSMAAGVVGFFVGSTHTGNIGQHRDRRAEGVTGFSDQIGNFLATRPITNSDFARVILQTAAKSTWIAWLVWAMAFGGTLLLLYLADWMPEKILPPTIEKWYLPMTLLLTWAAMANAAVIALSGRGTYFGVTFVGIVFGGVMLIIVTSTFASPEFGRQLFSLCRVVLSTLTVIGTVLAFIQARRSSLMPSAALYRTIAAATVITLLAFVLRPAGMSVLDYPSIIAFSALVVLPFATAPLAMAWNRHR